MNQITILFVDDHPLIRKAWKFVFDQDYRFQVIAECESGEDAIELTRRLCPDIVIMDVKLRGMSGIEATRSIRKICPNAKVIGISFDIRAEYVQQMLDSGAMGYVTKVSPVDMVFKAITEVHLGRTFISPELVPFMS